MHGHQTLFLLRLKVVASETTSSCIVVTVHVIKGREYSTYIVYIDAGSSITEMETLDVNSNKFWCFNHRDELDSIAQYSSRTPHTLLWSIVARILPVCMNRAIYNARLALFWAKRGSHPGPGCTCVVSQISKMSLLDTRAPLWWVSLFSFSVLYQSDITNLLASV